MVTPNKVEEAHHIASDTTREVPAVELGPEIHEAPLRRSKRKRNVIIAAGVVVVVVGAILGVWWSPRR
jgi:hypothetical protein